MPEHELALLTEAARTAGEIALRWWRKPVQVWDKPGGAGPVSAADLAVNAALAQMLRGARPDYGWLSEESADSARRLAAPRSFIIDPIDGTRSFLAGQDGFAHSLAVTEAGRVIAAVVFLPARGALYAATAGGPALKNGLPISAAANRPLAGAEVLTTAASSDPALWHDDQPPLWRRAFRPAIAWRLCLVAEGRFDAMLSLRPTWEWDSAAGSLIAERAGATVTDRTGAALGFNRPHPQACGLIAAPPALHAEIMGRLRPEDQPGAPAASNTPSNSTDDR